MIVPEAVRLYSREKNLSLQDAAQMFLQVLVLKHLNLSPARFMGGGALVFGYGNPRFSEDIDLTQVDNPLLLKTGLTKAASEIEGWFSAPVTLNPPKGKGRSWRLIVRLGRAESIRLHIDSQRNRAYTSQPVVIEYPSLQSFVVEALSLDEIMSEKIIALACRRYLGGRDLFDLWFHWLKTPEPTVSRAAVRQYVGQKLAERRLDLSDLLQKLEQRLRQAKTPERARDEWKRYLPPPFQKESVFEAILTGCRRLPELL